MSTRVLLVRHGESTWNAEGRWQGHANPPLSALGVRQARAAADHLGTVDAVVSSDLVRAATTASLVAGALGVGPVVVDARWRERDAGRWTGLTRAEIEARWPGALAARTWPEGWESEQSILARVTSALADTVALAPGGSVVVVSHGGVIRSFERHLGADHPAPLANLEAVVVHHDGTNTRLEGRRLLVDGEVTVTRPRMI